MEPERLSVRARGREGESVCVCVCVCVCQKTRVSACMLCGRGDTRYTQDPYVPQLHARKGRHVDTHTDARAYRG